ncbi:hypothetical protein CYMTET_53830 [Cymbomonas tetramitiformis]|uniref:Uncharacterized protein n=1 Tax=Cymbomonas tetramitiformis TaxID=36881 RepID=A0AAE0EPC2_9CHLO|nr:hypothetical protein CYMTET_53830 [Cymbomonas tetramitiformis]
MWHWPWQQDPYQQSYFPNSAARQHPTQQDYNEEYYSHFPAQQPNNVHSVGTGSYYAAPPVHYDASAAQYYALGKQGQTYDASGDQQEHFGGNPAISHQNPDGASEDSSLSAASGRELWSRIAELPAAMKEQMLKHAKVSERGSSGASRALCPEHSWAFSGRLPPLEVLLPAAAAVAQEPQTGSAAGALFAACSASAAACAAETGGPAGWGAYMGLQVGGIVLGEVLISKKSYLLIQVNEQTHVPQAIARYSDPFPACWVSVPFSMSVVPNQ